MDLNSISFSYNGDSILKDFSLSIPSNKVLAILGPSGCGKTTLLRLIAGTIDPIEGNIQGISGNLSYIFQEPRLLPWMNLIENVEFPMKDKKNNRALHYIQEMGLGDHIKKYPSQLSGGMTQRVSIARAFAFDSDLILMDEPFKGLDLQLKVNTFNLFNKLISKEKRTAIFVTHDIKESLILGDRIVVLEDKPVKIKKIFDNPINKELRTLDNRDVINLENELFQLISNL